MLALLPAARAEGQELYDFVLSGAVGIGGSLDQDEAGLTNLSYQLGAALVTDMRTHVAIRLGSIDFSGDEPLNRLYDPSLKYVNVAGEYMTKAGFFSGALIESGAYLGLGLYQLDGVLRIEETIEPQPPEEGELPEDPTTIVRFENDDQTAVGLAMGVFGDLPLSNLVAIRLDFSAHYALLDQAQIFLMAQAGLAFRF